MKKKVVTGIMLTLIILSMLTFPFNIQPVKSDSTTWIVDDDGEADFHTIQEAINAANPGDTIYVYNGTYHENVVVNKTLTLTGESRSNTIINGFELAYEGALVNIVADYVDMSGFTVTNALNQSIEAGDSWYCEVHDNIVCFTGDRGIVFGGGGKHNAYNNIVYNSSAYGGIEAIWSNNNTIYNNIAYFNQWGIATNHGSYNRIYNNTVHSNRGTGIHIDWPSTGNVIHNNNVSSNTNFGILVHNQANETVIRNNEISGSFWGIRLEETSGNSIYGNTITTNNGGIGLYLSSNTSLTENDMTNNEVGIFLNINSNNNSICGNIITTSYNNSIVLVYSSMNTISENTIINNYNGIQVHDSSNLNTISGNTIASNECGIQIRASNQNRFFHNNFMDNTQQVNILTPGDANHWDDGYPSGGNYWSDYAYIDFYNGPYQNETGSDGIGDLPYVIGENNQDNYPLMEPWYGEEFITIGTTVTIAVLDPAVTYRLFDCEIFNNIGEGLLKYKPGTTDLIYGIAKNYTVSPDGLNYTFMLREGMYFTDGEPLDAAAVKWSIDRVAHLNMDPSWLVSDFIDSVEIVNNLTVKFILKKAASFFPALVTTTPYFPVSSKSYPANETAEPTVGHYGPYRISSWTRDVELVLEANPNYYGAQPRSRYVVIKFFSNATMMRQALENGVIDVAWRGLRPMDIVELRENPDFKIVESHESLIRYITLRCNMAPFDDVRLRQAVAAAINRTRICTEAYLGTVDPLYSMVPMGMWSHIDAFKYRYGVRNLNLSRQLLAEAGYSESEKFAFNLWYYSAYADVAIVIESDLEETGMINVTLIGASLTEIIENMPEGIMQSFLLGWLPDYLDPDNYLRPFVYSEQSPDVGVFYNSTVMDNILDAAIATTNITIRTELYENASWLLAEDAPLVPFSQGTVYAVARSNIEGIYLSPTVILPYYTIYKHTPSTRYPWPMFHSNPSHTGYTESPAPNTNQILWNYTTGYFVQSSPAVASGMVFVGSNDQNVYALDQYTGAHIWNYTTGGSVYSSPAVVDGKVYVGSSDRKVYCLDASTGAFIWSYTTEAVVGESSPVVVDGKVYVGSLDYKVYCLDASTGVQIWNYTTGLVSSSPAVAYGKVYVGSYDAKVYCLDASTGALIWNHTTGGTVGSSPAVVDGRVYVGSDDYNIYCLNASSGAHIWNYTTGWPVRSSPAVVDGKVYVGSYDAKVYCLDAATGAHIWNHTVGSSVRSSPAIASGMVFVGSDEGKVYAIDQYTGTHIWNYTTGSHVYSSPAIADGMLFVGSDDYTVYAFGNIIRVPEDYPTVQEAIDAADEGATIIVAPGIYYESLVINKTVTIIGELGSAPIFDGGGSGIWAILLPGASGSTITNIMITNWDQGIFIVNSSDCKIYGNIMSLMGDSGIALEGDNAANNLIYNNIFQGNTIAINLTESSTTNIIYANTISGNDVGIDMTNSNSTIIYHNNFIDNTDQVIISMPAENIWDNGYEGNYWSDYEDKYPDAEEIDDLGIWNTPYEIAADNIDNYPLVKPFSGIGITDVITSKTVIGQGFTLRIDLIILNHGVDNEDSTVTVYIDTTPIAIQTITLTRITYTTITFTWDTTCWAKGSYTITAKATPVPGEIDTTDNTHIGGWVMVTILGDVNGDREVDVFDKVMVGAAFGATYNATDGKYWHQPPDFPGPCPYCPHNPNTDLNGDHIIDVFDKVIVGAHFGEADP